MFDDEMTVAKVNLDVKYVDNDKKMPPDEMSQDRMKVDQISEDKMILDKVL